MKTLKLALSIGLVAAVSALRAEATLIVTYAEHPGEMTSTLSNTYMETFDAMSTGLHATADWVSPSGTTVGTFTSLDIHAANQYGGAGNTNYAVTGIGVNTETILNLTTPSSYFGLWWSAGDAKNVLDFYSGANGTGTLLAEFTTANLLKKLTPKTVYNVDGTGGYYGNPNIVDAHTGLATRDTGEPFAFINFFGTPGTAWSSIKVTNNGSSGFEADNYTSRVQVYTPATDGPLPGHLVEAVTGTNVVALDSYSWPAGGVALVPEPSSKCAMLLLGALSFGGSLLRSFRKQAA